MRPNSQPGSVSNIASQRRFPPFPKDSLQLVMPYEMKGYAIDPADAASGFLEAVVPLSDALHYRMRTLQSYGVGGYEFCGLADGFFIFVGELEFQTPSSMYMSAPDMLRVRIATSGDGEYAPSVGEALSFEAPNTFVIIEPAGLPAAETTFAGYNRYVHVFIHRKALKALYAGSERDLPAVISAFLDGSLRQTVARALPLSSALLRCLEDAHACPLEGPHRRLFLQSKAVEILCFALEALEFDEGFGSAEASKLTARGILKAQKLLEENFVTPPTLEGLAHQVGLSRSGLCAGFRQILGQTVYDYILQLRMQQALALLNERGTTITEIAYAVGYHHVSSFTVAVKERFGATPTELRRRNT